MRLACPHSLDGVGVSAGDRAFEVLGMVNGKVDVTMFSVRKKWKKWINIGINYTVRQIIERKV